jgi:beta-lactamase regulating signal transducer with metallopeptidase domain
MISQLIHSVFAASLSSTALAIFFIPTRKIIIRFIGVKWSYYVWFSVFVPWVAIWVPLYFWTIPAVSIIYTIIKPILLPALVHTPIMSKIFLIITNGSKHSLILSKMFFILWLMGTLICLSYIIFRNFQFVLVLRKSSRPITLDEQEILNESLTSYQHKNISRIYLSKSILSPMICHILNSKIYLPNNFFHAYTLIEQKHILQHEYLHFQRRDLLANASMLLLGCINWFNPIIFFVYRYFPISQELSCDAMVSKRFTSYEKKSYGYTLLKTVINQSSETTSVSCWWNTGIELKERCQMLKINHSKPIKALVGVFTLVSMICTAIAVVSLENREALFAYSILSANSSDFVIKIFNNTTITQPIHYMVKSQGKELAEGELLEGDDNGEFITVGSSISGKASAEVIVDTKDQIIWKGIIIFYDKDKTFYTKLIKLDSRYILGTNIFRKMHVITFDIKGKN